jgi:hypothetical protein
MFAVMWVLAVDRRSWHHVRFYSIHNPRGCISNEWYTTDSTPDCAPSCVSGVTTPQDVLVVDSSSSHVTEPVHDRAAPSTSGRGPFSPGWASRHSAGLSCGGFQDRVRTRSARDRDAQGRTVTVATTVLAWET